MNRQTAKKTKITWVTPCVADQLAARNNAITRRTTTIKVSEYSEPMPRSK